MSLWSLYGPTIVSMFFHQQMKLSFIVPVVIVDKKTVKKISKILYSYHFYEKNGQIEYLQ